MLLDFNALYSKYNLKVKGVIQIGVHRGQEHHYYVEHGIDKMVYIEPNIENFNIIKERFGKDENVIMFNTACGDENGSKVAFVEHVNQGMSSSLLEPKIHLTQHKEVVFDDAEVWKVTRLDDLEFDRTAYNFINIDVQGYEAHVFRGGVETLKHIDYVISEVNREEMYAENALIEQLDAMLTDFQRVETGWASPTHGWGDSLYVRKTVLNV